MRIRKSIASLKFGHTLSCAYAGAEPTGYQKVADRALARLVAVRSNLPLLAGGTAGGWLHLLLPVGDDLGLSTRSGKKYG